MPSYESAQFHPPAPVAYVTLRNTDGGTVEHHVPMLLDTGADVTLVPAAVIHRLGLYLDNNKQYELVGFDGNTSFVPVVQLAMSFAGRTFRGQFLLIDQNYGIIGRNILNAVPLLLDGPRLAWGLAKTGS